MVEAKIKQNVKHNSTISSRHDTLLKCSQWDWKPRERKPCRTLKVIETCPVQSRH